jgi:hypothetical protein
MKQTHQKDGVVGQLEYRENSEERSSTRISLEKLRLGPFSLGRLIYEEDRIYFRSCLLSIGILLLGLFSCLLPVALALIR